MIQKTDGFIKWQRKLGDRRAQERIAIAITRLGFGLGDVKTVGGQVSELRIDYGPGYRVYFTRRGDEIIILLCGGDQVDAGCGHQEGEGDCRRPVKLRLDSYVRQGRQI